MSSDTAPAPGVKLPPGYVPLSNLRYGTDPQSGTTFSPSLNFEVTRINFRGADRSLDFKTRLSNLQKRAQTTYSAPHWLNHDDLHLTFSGLYDDSRDVRTFASNAWRVPRK